MTHTLRDASQIPHSTRVDGLRNFQHTRAGRDDFSLPRNAKETGLGR